MSIKRLLCPTDKVDNPYGLEYGNENGKDVIKAKESVSSAFADEKHKKMRYDCVLLNSIFRMGWNTAAVFEKQPNKFLKLNYLYDIEARKTKKMQEYDAHLFEQITTQAVDTCTLFYFETSKECILAHFEPDKVVNFAAMLEENIAFTAPVEHVFYSGGGTEAHKKEVPGIKEGYNGLVRWMHDKNPIVFDRMALTFANAKKMGPYLSHMEFGIAWDGRTATYFGDIVYRHMEEDPNPCPCITFECNEIEELNQMRQWAGVVLGLNAGLDAEVLEEV